MAVQVAAPHRRRPDFLLVVGLIALLLCIWPVGTFQTPRALARPVPVPAATTNPYWGGYVMSSSPGYVAVRATWSVPHIPCPSADHRDSTVYAWIGEGGYLQGLADPLLQAGTASDCFLGMPRYHAFYEWYPGIYATDFAVGVRAGDRVTMSVVETQTGVWTLSVRNNSNGEQAAVSTTAPVDARTADFIVERPTVCSGTACGQPRLARFGNVTFRDIQTLAAPGTPPELIPIALAGTSQPLAVPARLPADHHSFSVLWRAG